MKRYGLCAKLIALIVFLAPSLSATSQDRISFGGEVFSDYNYTFSSPAGELDGENSFGYRRVRLTTDYVISDRFIGRFRLEGTDSQTNSQGSPDPYIKDMYVTWKNAFGEGHNVTFGVHRPDIWSASEKHWGYRSLEKTLQDKNKIASSRDGGISVKGPLTSNGKLFYSFMFGNNSSIKRETNKYKRVYGQLEFRPSDDLVFTAGSDYYAFEGGSSVNFNGFVGYTLSEAKLGLEGFYNPKSFDDVDGEDLRSGISAFGTWDLSDDHRLIARYDMTSRDNIGAETADDWAILGFAFRLDPGIEIVPNLMYDMSDTNDDPTITGRLTIWAKF